MYCPRSGALSYVSGPIFRLTVRLDGARREGHRELRSNIAEPVLNRHRCDWRGKNPDRKCNGRDSPCGTAAVLVIRHAEPLFFEARTA